MVFVRGASMPLAPLPCERPTDGVGDPHCLIFTAIRLDLLSALQDDSPNKCSRWVCLFKKRQPIHSAHHRLSS